MQVLRSTAHTRRGRGDSLAFHADAELIAGPNDFSARDNQLELLFALHLPAGLVLQRGHDLLRGGVDDLPRGRVRCAAIDAEVDPADAIARLDGGDLLGRHYGGI